MSRERLLKELELITQTMVQGGLSCTTRTCGKSACPCHTDPARRHGPNCYFTWRSDGKARALYVPPKFIEEAKQGQTAWARYWEIGLELAALNREQMKKRWKRSTAEAKRKGTA